MNEDIAIRKVSREDEKRILRDIVAGEYAEQGYISARNECLVRSPHYDGVFGIRFAVEEQSKKQTVGTIALVIDSETGLLPMDTLYHDELALLRERGLRIAEVGQFAVLSDTPMRKRLHIVRRLFAAIISELEEQETDVVVITVNPKHDNAYTMFGFSTFGNIKPYTAVGGALAVPKLKFLQKKPSHTISQYPNTISSANI